MTPTPLQDIQVGDVVTDLEGAKVGEVVEVTHAIKVKFAENHFWLWEKARLNGLRTTLPMHAILQKMLPNVASLNVVRL